ncbi:MAG: PQQ-dependent sugar dehydrogenase [Povalibacter sp.]
MTAAFLTLSLGLATHEGAAQDGATPAVDLGQNPQLVAPEEKLIPTVNVAPARGWPENRTPRAAAGLNVNAFAIGLEHPRWLYVLPNGDVLVAETNAPERPEDGKGIKGWVMKRAQKKAGAGVPSPNRITLLRDTDGDGNAEGRYRFIENLNSPFGMALVGNVLYVANTDALLKFDYVPGSTSISSAGTKVADLPAGEINHHWTKNVLASPDGSKLYVTVGSNSNAAENGLDAEENRAAILEIDARTGNTRVFASGLRNPNGLAWEPRTGALWTAVNERDELGNDLVPDYITSVREGAFYGWPFSYYGQHIDERVEPQRPDLVAQAVAPDYALGSHVAALGLTFIQTAALPERFRGGALVGLHGSWNRKPPSGYKVVFVAFEQGHPTGVPREFLTGFLSEDGDAFGRPVGVVIDARGAVLVADDVGNCVWRVASAH